MEDFIIDQVGWYKDEPMSHNVELSFRTLAAFLQENGLASRTLLTPETKIDDEFAIRSGDLTAEGLEFMKKYYEKWADSLDAGASEADVRLLEKSLAALRKHQKKP